MKSAPKRPPIVQAATPDDPTVQAEKSKEATRLRRARAQNTTILSQMNEWQKQSLG